MIDLLKNTIGKEHKLIAHKGVFFSLFDSNGKLIFSKGMIEVDKSLDQIIDIFYHSFFSQLEDQIKLIVVDVVTHLEELYDYGVINKIDWTKNGVAVQQLEGELGGVILPNTEGVADVKQLFSLIKKKNNLNGNIKVFLFQTQRIVVEYKK
ncbi:MAG TPA: hypothetical protein PLW93_04315 [Candidatus Absconditabacterales bacterium]|nr:hypothetical protein [Candidatus Absconditabacterales bacterium]HNG97466.1 hypothetical protein [Candidatus Absconditabacterales bacterium]